jgi:hypothetical protein
MHVYIILAMLLKFYRLDCLGFLLTSLVVCLPIGKEGRSSSKKLSEKVVGEEEGSHAACNRHA